MIEAADRRRREVDASPCPPPRWWHIEWLAPEIAAGSTALGLLIAGAIRLLTAESPHPAVVADLRDSLEDARAEVDQLKKPRSDEVMAEGQLTFEASAPVDSESFDQVDGDVEPIVEWDAPDTRESPGYLHREPGDEGKSKAMGCRQAARVSL